MTEIDEDKLASDTNALGAFNKRMVEEFRTNSGKVEGLPGGEVGTESYAVVAHEVAHDEFYVKVVQQAPVLEEYQSKTNRVIPLFELTRD